MKAIFSLALYLTVSTVGYTQSMQRYAIVYEKKLNLANLYKKWRINDKEEKFYKEEFKLLTNSEKSIYSKIQNSEHDENYLSSYMTYSTTFLDFKNKMQTSQKEIGEKTFLMKDSIPNLQWYIHDDTREIAGYSCTKAMAKLEDSIIIVAYFTDLLEAPIGPESIGGLPGTILGMVIPRLHTTWLAKSVEKMDENSNQTITPPSTGKITNSKDLFKLAKEVYKEYETVNSIVWRVIL